MGSNESMIKNNIRILGFKYKSKTSIQVSTILKKIKVLFSVDISCFLGLLIALPGLFVIKNVLFRVYIGFRIELGFKISKTDLN